MSPLPALVVAAVAAAAPPPSVTPPAGGGPTTPEVTVVAPRSAAAPPSLGRRAEEVQGVLATPRDQQTARWADLYCPRVSGLEAGQEDRIAARMRDGAREAGLGLGRSDCRPNVVVLVADDPNGEVERLLARNDRFFGDARATEVRAALEGDRPVRWFSVSLKKSVDGFDLDPPPFKFRAGHILAHDRYDLAAVVVLVDATKVNGLGLSALADYLALVSLAQVRPDPPAPHPATVLDLFDDPGAGRTRAAGLTAWDRTFLKGLYGLDPASNPGMQRFGVAEALAKAGAAGAPAPSPAPAGGR